MNTAADRPPRRRPQAILFDWDNTLVDTWPVIHEVLNATLAAFGLEAWSLEKTRRDVRRSMRDSFPALFGERWEEAGEVFYERFRRLHLNRLEACPGAASMLATLAEAGIYLGVVSNKKGEFLRREAAHLGWDGYFGRLVGALDADRDKPAAAPVDLALAGSGIAAGSGVWIAGDADIDLECAVNTGCVPVLVRPTAPGPGEFDAHPPAWHFDSPLALCNFILSL